MTIPKSTSITDEDYSQRRSDTVRLFRWVVPTSRSTGSVKRNLEDFARLWIYIGAFYEPIQTGQIHVGLRWKNVYSGTTPAVNIYPSFDSEGSDDYLKNETAAQAQITGVFNEAVRDIGNVQTIDANTVFLFKTDYWIGVDMEHPKKCFLFEGAGEGKGELEIVFYDSNYDEIGHGGSVWLDLKNIERISSEAMHMLQIGDCPIEF